MPAQLVGVQPAFSMRERTRPCVSALFGIPRRPEATGSSITLSASAKSPCRAGLTGRASRFFSRLDSVAPGRATDRKALRTFSGPSA